MDWQKEVSKIARLCAELYVDSNCHVNPSNPFSHTEYKDFFEDEMEDWIRHHVRKTHEENEGTEDDIKYVNI